MCVAACTTGQVLGYKLQLDQALETSEAKHRFLVLHEWQAEIWGWQNYFLTEEQETPVNQLWHVILFKMCRRAEIVLFLNAEQSVSKPAPPIDSVPQRGWCFCLFSELCWPFLWLSACVDTWSWAQSPASVCRRASRLWPATVNIGTSIFPSISTAKGRRMAVSDLSLRKNLDIVAHDGPSSLR